MRLRFGLAALSNRHFDNALVPLRTPHKEYVPRYLEAGFEAFELAEAYHGPLRETTLERLARFPAEVQVSWKLSKHAVAPEGRQWGGLERDAAFASMARSTQWPRAVGPVVLQFPPSFRNEAGNLEWLATLLEGSPEAVVELRHPSWWTDDVKAVLESTGTGLVWGTYPKAQTPAWVTTDTGYVRFVGPHHKTRGRPVAVADRTEDLLVWRERLAQGPWDGCTVIVTNTFEGNAIDSLPKVAAALGATRRATRWSRKPGEALLGGPPPGQGILDLD